MENVYIFIFFMGLVFLYGWARMGTRPFNEVSTGVKSYTLGCPRAIRHDQPFKIPNKTIERSNLMFARVMDDDCPEWKLGTRLIINQAFVSYFKGHFYLFEQDGKYRVCKCIGNSSGFPPIFDGSETFITHNIVGEVIGTYDPKTNTHDYSIYNPRQS